MRIGILADIHEDLGHLRWAIDVLHQQGADRLVVLGDVFEMGHRLRETVALLAEAGAIGVWGNHDFGLCRDNPRPEVRRHYGNAIYIPPFFGDPTDEVLPRLARFLVSLRDVPNVRTLEKRGWAGGVR